MKSECQKDSIQHISSLEKRVSSLQKENMVLTEQIFFFQKKLNNSNIWSFVKTSPYKRSGLINRIKSKIKLTLDVRLIENSGFFDKSWYLAKYPDVSESNTKPAIHYLLYGAHEGRLPSRKFNTEWYLQKYEDVLSSGENPLIHYLKFGRKEKRQPLPGLSNYD